MGNVERCRCGRTVYECSEKGRASTWNGVHYGHDRVETSEIGKS